MNEEAKLILERIKKGEQDGGLANDLLRHLRSGFPLDCVRELIASENRRASSAGVFLLEELRDKAAPLQDVALELSESRDASRRSAFVRFATYLKHPGQAILKKVYDILGDLDLGTRCTAIEWVVIASMEDTFSLCRIATNRYHEHIAEVVSFLENEDQKNRNFRALRIGLMLKLGKKRESIFEKIEMEDSFTIDFFRYKETGRRTVKFRPNKI
jgi:hypothetical protein